MENVEKWGKMTHTLSQLLTVSPLHTMKLQWNVIVSLVEPGIMKAGKYTLVIVTNSGSTSRIV